MDVSRRIAGILGPTLMVVTASELLNFRIWSGVAAPVVYLNGALLFVTGLWIVRTHNVWTLRWPVLVTLVGWAALAGGLYRLFAPGAPQAGEGLATTIGILSLGAIGLFLTFKAYAGAGDGDDG